MILRPLPRAAVCTGCRDELQAGDPALRDPVSAVVLCARCAEREAEVVAEAAITRKGNR